MGLRINTNVYSLTAQRNLSRATEALNGSFRRLATGRRIAISADDPAGLAIAERLRARIRSTDQAARNAEDGISLVQTAEGALQEVNALMIRMRELAVQSSNGTYNPDDRTALDAEFSALIEEVDRIANQTSFNTIKLLDGSLTSAIRLQVGADTALGVDTLDVTSGDATATNLGILTLSIATVSGASSAIAALDLAIDTISQQRGDIGAAQNRLTAVISNLQIASENLSAAESRIRDVDVAAETAALTKTSILQQAAISILAQANIQPQAALSLLQG